MGNSIYLSLIQLSVRIALEGTLAQMFQQRSLGRPRDRYVNGAALAFVFVDCTGPERRIVAYCELCMLEADGNRPADTDQLLLMMARTPLSASAKPYCLNLCVSPERRRS